MSIFRSNRINMEDYVFPRQVYSDCRALKMLQFRNRFKYQYNRLETFQGNLTGPFDREKGIDYDKAARWGLFKFETIDRLKCAFCDIIITNWKQGDDPAQLHHNASPGCPLILNAEEAGNKTSDFEWSMLNDEIRDRMMFMPARVRSMVRLYCPGVSNIEYSIAQGTFPPLRSSSSTLTGEGSKMPPMNLLISIPSTPSLSIAHSMVRIKFKTMREALNVHFEMERRNKLSRDSYGVTPFPTSYEVVRDLYPNLIPKFVENTPPSDEEEEEEGEESTQYYDDITISEPMAGQYGSPSRISDSEESTQEQPAISPPTVDNESNVPATHGPKIIVRDEENLCGNATLGKNQTRETTTLLPSTLSSSSLPSTSSSSSSTKLKKWGKLKDLSNAAAHKNQKRETTSPPNADTSQLPSTSSSSSSTSPSSRLKKWAKTYCRMGEKSVYRINSDTRTLEASQNSVNEEAPQESTSIFTSQQTPSSSESVLASTENASADNQDLNPLPPQFTHESDRREITKSGNNSATMRVIIPLIPHQLQQQNFTLPGTSQTADLSTPPPVPPRTSSQNGNFTQYWHRPESGSPIVASGTLGMQPRLPPRAQQEINHVPRFTPTCGIHPTVPLRPESDANGYRPFSFDRIERKPSGVVFGVHSPPPPPPPPTEHVEQREERNCSPVETASEPKIPRLVAIGNNDNDDDANKQTEKSSESPSPPQNVEFENVLRKCVICLEKDYEMVMLPCLHLNSCYGCSSKILNCPTCRKPIMKRFKVFLA